MKGLELSEILCREHLRPLMESRLKEVLPFLAAGLVGEGSECFGYDDEISADHDAEVRICLWLPADKYLEYKQDVETILRMLPEKIEGVPVNRISTLRSGVFEISNFYKGLIGVPGIPTNNEQWESILMPKLASAVNGRAFFDNYGEFSKIREGLQNFYPEDVRLHKLAEAIAIAGQSGQYNYTRILKRKDLLAANMAKAQYVDYAAKAVFLLEKEYEPFYKWAFRKMKKLSSFGEEMYKLLDLIMRSNGEEAAEYIEEASARIIDELLRQQLTDSKSDFLMEHLQDLMRRIKDPSVRNKGVSLVR